MTCCTMRPCSAGRPALRLPQTSLSACRHVTRLRPGGPLQDPNKFMLARNPKTSSHVHAIHALLCCLNNDCVPGVMLVLFATHLLAGFSVNSHPCHAQATLVRDANARWLLPGDGGGETPRLQSARTYSLMAVACPSRGGGGGRAGGLTSKDVVRMLVNSMRCACTLEVINSHMRSRTAAFVVSQVLFPG